jgi:hypothetical protein
VDLETAYATRERELVAAYEATLAVNAEILGHVRQKIREHDERELGGQVTKNSEEEPYVCADEQLSEVTEERLTCSLYFVW